MRRTHIRTALLGLAYDINQQVGRQDDIDILYKMQERVNKLVHNHEQEEYYNKSEYRRSVEAKNG